MRRWNDQKRNALHSLIKRGGVRFTSLLLAAILLLPGGAMLPQNAEAAYGDLTEDVSDDNTYALQVSTGTLNVQGSLADEILYFNVVYEDTDGYVRSHRIFPGENALRDSMDWANDQAKTDAEASENAGESPEEEYEEYYNFYTMRWEKRPKGTSSTSTGSTGSTGSSTSGRWWETGSNSGSTETSNALVENLTRLGVSVTREEEPFQPYSTDTFFFQPLKKVKSIQRIEILSCDKVTETRDLTNGTWTCQDLRVYKVAHIRGMQSYGYASGCKYADFDGTMIARMEKPVTYNWNADAIFRITSDGREEGKLVQTEEAYSTATTPRVFRMDIADTYGAGIRALGNAVGQGITASQFGECAAFTLRYVDIYGTTREVYVPFVTSVLSYALEKGVSGTEKLSGIAQDGDTLALAVSLPDMASLTSVRFVYGTDAAKQLTGVAASSTGRAVNPTESADDSVDLLSVTGFSVYDPSETEITVSVQGTKLVPVFKGTPLSYYRAPSASGTAIRPVKAGDIGTELRLTDYEQGALLLPRDSSDAERYLVVLTTDDSELAGTTGELQMMLNYIDLNGQAQNSGMLSVSEAAGSYYGEWPGVREGFMYRAGVRGGGSLQFVVSLKDVDKFTGVRFRVRDSRDDWQMKKLELYRLDSLSTLSAEWTTVTDGAQTSDRRYFRSFSGDKLLELNERILVDSDSTGTDFTSESTVTPTQDSGDWSEHRYSMTYEQTKELSAFAKSRCHYTVAVEVGSDQVTDANSGDCGSKNQFYFQLVFEDGKSAYVLANQQLAADGFRTGYTETFTISTNRDMGELTAIKILPEDSSDRSDVFDKLKIESIHVNKQTNEAVTRQWVVSNVGWIDINYQDEAANSSSVGYRGRTEAELVKNYQVEASTYAVNLEFGLTTGAYNETINTKQIEPQFEGQLYGIVEYYDYNGARKTETFNLVEAMYDYDGKEKKIGKEDTIGQFRWPGGTESDPNLMFRAGKTDRFTLGIEGISQLLRVTLQARSRTVTTWNIEGMYVSLAGNGGRRLINAANEYQLEYEKEPEQLCSSTNGDDRPYSLQLPLNQVQEIEIDFTENSIEWADSVKGQISSVTSRLPRSADDSLNVYVYLQESGDAPASLSGITMEAGAQYSRVYGGFSRVEQTLVPGENDGRKMFYGLGVPASGIDALNRLDLVAYYNDMSTSGMVPVDYAIVQQVRSGVVINTYRIDFTGADAAADSKGVSREPEAKADRSAFRQTVSLSFGSLLGDGGSQTVGGMDTLRLTPETDDVAVALRYTTTNDLTRREYESAFLYLTDQDWTELWAGRVVDLTFNEPYVKEITGIKLRGTGHSTRDMVSVSAANALAYEASGTDDGYRCTGRFSFADGVRLTTGSGDQVMICTSGNGSGIGGVGELTITFNVPTADEVPKASENADGVIGAVLGYRDVNGVSRELSIYDLREYAVGGNSGFLPGSTVTVRMLLPNASEVRWLSLSPTYDAGNDGVLLLSDINAVFQLGAKQVTCQRDLKDWSGYGLIALSNAIRVSLSAVTTNPKTGVQETISTDNGAASPLVQSGQSVIITPILEGTDGYTVRAERYRGDFAANAPETITVNGDQIIFLATNEYSAGTGETLSYRVIVTSKEIPAMQAVLNIGVEPVYVDKGSPAASSGGAESLSSAGEADASSAPENSAAAEETA